MKLTKTIMVCLGLSLSWGECVASAGQSDSLIQAIPIPPLVASRLDSMQQESLQKSLADAGDNAPQLIGGLENLSGPLVEDGVFLIQNMPHLDRLEMTKEILLHHVAYADSSRRAFPWSVPDSLYQQFILTYRLDQEPITDWRAKLWPWVMEQAKETKSSEDFARQINLWIAKNMVEQKGEFFGGQQAPDQTFAVHRGTKQEIASLTAALLKTAGIPSRKVGVYALLSQPGNADWTEVFCVEKAAWLPLYPEAPDHFGDFSYHEPDSLQANIPYALVSSAFEMLDVTPSYTQVGDLQVSFTRAGSPAVGFDGFSINVFNAGAFSAIDALEAIADSAGNYHCRLGEGCYWIIAATRDVTGSPFIHLQSVEVHPGETTSLAINLTPATYVASGQNAVGDTAAVPMFSIADGAANLRSSREAVGKAPLLIIVLYPRHEPSIRMADLVRAWLAKKGANAPQCLWVMEGDKDENGPAELAFDPEQRIGPLFGLMSSDDHPLIVWVDQAGRMSWVSRGYNLNIEARLEEGEGN